MASAPVNRERHAVAAVVFRSDGLVLSGQRSVRKRTDVGCWQFPKGGVEASDATVEEAMWRELAEETALQRPLHPLQLVARLPDTLRVLEDGKARRTTWFVVRLGGPQASVAGLLGHDDEFAATAFVTWDWVLQRCPPPARPDIEAVRALAEPLIARALQPDAACCSSSAVGCADNCPL
eukprot:m51a1_g4290 hypothetical protein (179) ;mRNA; r:402216-403597